MNRLFGTALLLLATTAAGCTGHDERSALPPSIRLEGERAVFTLRDAGYRTAEMGIDLFGTWRMLPMEQEEGVWKVVVLNPGGVVHYKFLVDGEAWITDPRNPDRSPLAPPLQGFNSVVRLSSVTIPPQVEP